MLDCVCIMTRVCSMTSASINATNTKDLQNGVLNYVCPMTSALINATNTEQFNGIIFFS